MRHAVDSVRQRSWGIAYSDASGIWRLWKFCQHNEQEQTSLQGCSRLFVGAFTRIIQTGKAAEARQHSRFRGLYT